MPERPDPIEDLRHALYWLCMVLATTSGLMIAQTLHNVVAEDWVKATCTGVLALLFGLGWVRTVARGDRYRRFTFKANHIPNPSFHAGTDAWLRQYETKRVNGDAEETL